MLGSIAYLVEYLSNMQSPGFDPQNHAHWNGSADTHGCLLHKFQAILTQIPKTLAVGVRRGVMLEQCSVSSASYVDRC